MDAPLLRSLRNEPSLPLPSAEGSQVVRDRLEMRWCEAADDGFENPRPAWLKCPQRGRIEPGRARPHRVGCRRWGRDRTDRSRRLTFDGVHTPAGTPQIP